MATATPIYDPSLSGGGGGFTPTGDYFIPFGNVGHTTLIDSAKLTFNESTNTFAVAAASSGGTVSALVSNTSNTASSVARLIARVAGATAGNAGLTLGITGGSDWTLDNENATNDRFVLAKAATNYLIVDPTVANNRYRFLASGSSEIVMGPWSATGDTRAGVMLQTAALGASQYFNIGANSDGTAGKGVAFFAHNGTKWTHAISFANATSITLALVENGGGNAMLGGLAAPAALDRGLGFANGTAPSADPSGGGVLWSAGAILSYRGSGVTTGIQNLSRTYRAIANVNSTVALADDNGVVAYTSLATSDKTCTLPNLAAVPNGFKVTVYLDCVAGGLKVTVSGDGNIVGVASFLLDTDYEAATFVKNATDWTVI